MLRFQSGGREPRSSPRDVRRAFPAREGPQVVVAAEDHRRVLHAGRELLQLRHLHRGRLGHARYGGKSLHEQSHGESFISLFAHRFEQGIYILDEPEAALSPQRQLSFLRIIHDLSTPGHAQFIIATHSPIILSYPGAVLFNLDADTIQEIAYRETNHFLITRDFLNSLESFFKHLFNAAEPGDGDG